MAEASAPAGSKPKLAKSLKLFDVYAVATGAMFSNLSQGLTNHKL